MLRPDHVARNTAEIAALTGDPLLFCWRGLMKEANVAAKPVAPSFARPQDTAGLGAAIVNIPVKLLIEGLTRLGLLRKDLDYHLMRAAMVLIFLLFGYQKWFEYEAQVLIPFISNGPLISWMYPAFGVRGASWFLGVSEWLFGTLLFLGFWNKRLGILGAAGSCITFLSTISIIPFMPDGWAPSAGGFPAMVGNVPFLMKDVVLFAASFYLLKQDVERVMASQQAGARSSREH
jgi:uncharacterized membrane protein YkgB